MSTDNVHGMTHTQDNSQLDNERLLGDQSRIKLSRIKRNAQSPILANYNPRAITNAHNIFLSSLSHKKSTYPCQNKTPNKQGSLKKVIPYRLGRRDQMMDTRLSNSVEGKLSQVKGLNNIKCHNQEEVSEIKILPKLNIQHEENVFDGTEIMKKGKRIHSRVDQQGEKAQEEMNKSIDVCTNSRVEDRNSVRKRTQLIYSCRISPQIGQHNEGNNKQNDRKEGENKANERKEGESKTNNKNEGDNKLTDRQEGQGKQNERKEGKEGEVKQNDRKEGEGKVNDQNEGENKANEQKEGEGKVNERKEGDNKVNDRKEGENRANERKEGENNANERKDEEIHQDSLVKRYNFLLHSECSTMQRVDKMTINYPDKEEGTKYYTQVKYKSRPSGDRRATMQHEQMIDAQENSIKRGYSQKGWIQKDTNKSFLYMNANQRHHQVDPQRRIAIEQLKSKLCINVRNESVLAIKNSVQSNYNSISYPYHNTNHSNLTEGEYVAGNNIRNKPHQSEECIYPLRLLNQNVNQYVDQNSNMPLIPQSASYKQPFSRSNQQQIKQNQGNGPSIAQLKGQSNQNLTEILGSDDKKKMRCRSRTGVPQQQWQQQLIQGKKGKYSFHKLNKQKRELNNINNQMTSCLQDTGDIDSSVAIHQTTHVFDTHQFNHQNLNCRQKTGIYEDESNISADEDTNQENDSPDFKQMRKYYNKKYGLKLYQNTDTKQDSLNHPPPPFKSAQQQSSLTEQHIFNAFSSNSAVHKSIGVNVSSSVAKPKNNPKYISLSNSGIRQSNRQMSSSGDECEIPTHHFPLVSSFDPVEKEVPKQAHQRVASSYCQNVTTNKNKQHKTINLTNIHDPQDDIDILPWAND